MSCGAIRLPGSLSRALSRFDAIAPRPREAYTRATAYSMRARLFRNASTSITYKTVLRRAMAALANRPDDVEAQVFTRSHSISALPTENYANR